MVKSGSEREREREWWWWCMVQTRDSINTTVAAAIISAPRLGRSKKMSSCLTDVGWRLSILQK